MAKFGVCSSTFFWGSIKTSLTNVALGSLCSKIGSIHPVVWATIDFYVKSPTMEYISSNMSFALFWWRGHRSERSNYKMLARPRFKIAKPTTYGTTAWCLLCMGGAAFSCAVSQTNLVWFYTDDSGHTLSNII